MQQRDGSFKRKALSDFVSKNKLPLVVPFTRETSDAIIACFVAAILREVCG